LFTLNAGVAKEICNNFKRRPKIMTDKPNTETALDSNVQVTLSRLTLDNGKLQKELQNALEENKALKTQNVQLASVIETDLKTDLKLRIMAKSEFKESDLEPLTVEQLQQIDETLCKSKGADSVSYKSIHAGSDSQTGRTTVGSLYGKSHKEILDMGGNF
jgi:regulator of replication initiation timing